MRQHRNRARNYRYRTGRTPGLPYLRAVRSRWKSLLRLAVRIVRNLNT